MSIKKLNDRSLDGTIRVPTIALSVLCVVCLLGCEKTPKNVSDDLGALREIVHLNMRATSARWEMFGFPESPGVGFLPANIDATILVAELTPVDNQAFSIAPPRDTPYSAYGAARPWLDERFRALLGNASRPLVDLSANARCRPLKAIFVKKNAPVEGFICHSGNKALVYLAFEWYT